MSSAAALPLEMMMNWLPNLVSVGYSGFYSLVLRIRALLVRDLPLRLQSIEQHFLLSRK